MSELDAARHRALHSGGISGGSAFYAFVCRGLEEQLPGTAVLDLGCGTGGFGRYLDERFGVRPDGMDLIQHAGFDPRHYSAFRVCDLGHLRIGEIERQWDFIFAVGLIEYLPNPRSFIQAAASHLAPAGRLVLTSPNTASLRSLFSLARTGEFSAFKEATNPASITPVLPLDARRMLGEAGLADIRLDYSGHGRIPGGKLLWGQLSRRARGRLFSDDFRILGKRQAGPGSSSTS